MGRIAPIREDTTNQESVTDMNEKQYVLEWSKKSNGFHVQPLSDLLAKNQELFLSDRSHDYILLMVGPLDTVTKMAETHRHVLDGRSLRAA